MPLYVGETLEITNSVTDFDGTTIITPTILGSGSVTVEIVDSDDNVVLQASSMTWDSTRNLWFYRWGTSGMVPGAYEGKVVLTGVDGSESFQFVRIHLKEPSF